MAKKSEKSKKDIIEKIERDVSRAVEKIAGSSMKERLKKRKRKIPYFYITAIFIILLIAVFAYAVFRAPSAEIGDMVRVSYKGAFENNTIFDEGEIEFRIGENRMPVQGFEYGMIGIKEGEQKRLIVEPRHAYGDWSTYDLEILNATYTVETKFVLPLSDAEKITDESIQIGNSIRLQNHLWLVEVLDIDRDFGEVLFKHLPVNNSIYYNPLVNWCQIRVLDINEQNITLRYEPKIGTSVISKTGKKGHVIKVDDENVVIDYNHPLAGQSLIFDVKLEKLTK